MLASAVITRVAALMNDSAQTEYTNAVVVPYLNMAMEELQEIFEQNNIPVTNEVSAAITVPIGTTEVGFTTTPALPADLIEIRRLWERTTGIDPYTPMQKVETISHNLEATETSHFGIWAWQDEKIIVLSSTAAIDLRIDYIKSIFTEVTDATGQAITIKNTTTWLQYMTAALCAQFIAENPTRAQVLGVKADEALDRTLGISTKGRQSIITRKQPFRARWKSRGY